MKILNFSTFQINSVNSGSEINKYARRHLKSSSLRPRKLYKRAGESKDVVDVYTAGFPCQPYSSADKRKGRKDCRDLSGTVQGYILEHRPRIFVLENVPGFCRGKHKVWRLGLGGVLMSQVLMLQVL